MTIDSLTSFIKQELFICDMKARTKENAIKELVDTLVETRRIKNDRVVLETIMQREALGSTGIGKSVAIPHCRSLAVMNVEIVVGFSKKGIPFKSKDKKDVHLILLIIAPPVEEKDQYLPILGKMCEILNHTKTRNKLIEATDYDSFITVMQGE